MPCRIAQLRNKEVINMKNGVRIGFINDIEIDMQTARISAIVVYGRLRWFGLLGRERDFVIDWKNVVLFGDDAVLVNYEEQQKEPKKTGLAKWVKKFEL
jgi:sporulation protein, YlmC/YmxH family